VQRPLASVVVGGMFIGPVLLLLVVPALQIMFLRASDAGAAGVVATKGRE
jgi:heavy metal efflux system protein